MIKKILLITSQFPYGNGEQFLETEIKYYSDIEVVLMPKFNFGDLRQVPNGIKVDNFLSKNSFTKKKIIYLFQSFGSKIFFKELISENFLNINKFKIFLSSMYQYQMYYELLDRYFSKIKNHKNIIVYTYWNDETTYALQTLKKKFKYKLVSRIHRGDIYKEIKPFSYMPFKKHFTKNIDTIYTITESANEYLHYTYGFDKNILKLSRLGVEDRGIQTKCSPDNQLSIVSCSFLTRVKQVDKIIKTLKLISCKMKHIKFLWTHIGDGILFDNLLSYAKKELSSIDNVRYQLVGHYENKKVFDFYASNKIDVFLNVSLSEGVPVSIMEAMSCGIPIVAPNVGGVSDMIEDGKSGFLLNKEFNIYELADLLKNIDFFKDEDVRVRSYKIFLEKYEAMKNYKNFIQDILKISYS